MSNNTKLYRNFIILQEDERGYANSSDKTLSGYSKIEARGDKCKISFYAQNLRRDTDKYCMMLICCKKDLKQVIDLGPIEINDAGKGELTKEYYSSNIGGLDIPFEKISGATIAKMKDGIPVYVMCGFLNGEQPSDNWKSYKVVKATEGKEKPIEVKKEVKKEEKKEEKKQVVKEVKELKVKVHEVEIEKDGCEQKVSKRGKFDDYEDQIEVDKEFDPDTCKIRGSIGEYFEAIADGFEGYRGGFNEIKYCKWYKVPVNDLYEMCNMSNYNRYTLAYYPMLNYYPYIRKYGHFMLGYKCDSEGNLKYIVYGVPGKKDRDEQPYDGKTGFVTWVRSNENDEVGCWLMFYDFKNSTVVVPMQ